MKVNDYVRTDKGILKIRDDRPFKDDKNKLNYLTYGNYTCVLKEDIIKSSLNIIDLIEIGDYVNGEKVIGIGNFVQIDEKIYLSKEDIKTIVTKEQFESMEYKVKE